jgi:AcrR family transcriptional regulator
MVKWLMRRQVIGASTMTAMIESVMKQGRTPTRIALIEAAEKQFAEVGIHAVSLRQIGTAIGSSNANVVGYHFGTKAALIEAVFEHRVGDLDARRGELLQELDARDESTGLVPLLRALWLPLFEQVNDAGLRSYARFLGALIRSGRGDARRAFAKDYSFTRELTLRVQQHLTAAALPFREERWRISVLLVLDALQMIDEAGQMDPLQQRRTFEETLSMTAAALMAPTAEK